MYDGTVDPSPDTDKESNDVEIPVAVDSLAVDGVSPEVGDRVSVKVGGVVTRVVNKIGYVKPETINDAPLPAPVLEPDDMTSESDRLKRLSQTVGNDIGGSY